MTPERWKKIKGVFDAALEIEPSKRIKFLDNACVNDAKLRGEVQNLLDSFEQAESFIEHPAAGEVASLILEPKQSLKEGQHFAHYKILRQIGVGGMGEVYLAKDEKLDRRVAIKLLNEQFNRDKSNLERFIREAKAASGLNHPNILVIHEIGEEDGLRYIVSEFIEGKTLREIAEDSSMKMSELLDTATQIVSAMTAAHGARIVHRDLKPENIMIRPDGYVKILDFGLAKLVEHKVVGLEEATEKQNQTARGVILGTVNYMSPEQAKGEMVDERTDIFSFGVLFYEMIAGRTPFAGDSMSESFANLINKEPQPLSRFSTNVPDELQRISAKTLRKNKDERYQTMKDLLTDLRDLRENLAFDERLEKSNSPNAELVTGVLQTATGDVNNETASTDHKFTGQIKRNRSLSMLAMAVLLIGAIGVGYYFLFARKASSPADGRKSLAVLPFVNAGQDANAEYLSDGITESVINNLSQLGGLKVMSRNSAFRFKNNQTDTRSIASQLGVETLVTGDIKQIGDKFFINVRLIDASDDSQIWGNQYVKTSGDIIAAQNEIAQAVVQNLRLKLTNSERQRLGKNYTENVEAYELYMKGRYHALNLTRAETDKGIAYFQQAIELDPNYALAYVGLTESYLPMALTSSVPSWEVLPKAKATAQRAVEIDETLAEAHAALGFITFWYDWNWQVAEKEYLRALELNPNSAEAHFKYAHLLSNTGRNSQALTEIKLARELDPVSLVVNAAEGQILFFAGRSDESLDRLSKTIDLSPNFWLSYLFISVVYTEKGMYAEAVAAAKKAGELSGNSQSEAYRAYALAKWGKLDEARAVLDELLKLSNECYVPPYNLAVVYNGLGKSDKALDYLEKGFAEKNVLMVFLKVDPKWNNLRSEPRFIELMKQMNFE